MALAPQPFRPSGVRHAPRTARVVLTRAEGTAQVSYILKQWRHTFNFLAWASPGTNTQADNSVTRRSLGALLGGALLLANTKPSLAAYGDAAKIFGKRLGP